MEENNSRVKYSEKICSKTAASIVYIYEGRKNAKGHKGAKEG